MIKGKKQRGVLRQNHNMHGNLSTALKTLFPPPIHFAAFAALVRSIPYRAARRVHHVKPP
jgi:hypothetical protein